MGYLYTATHRTGDVENIIRVCSESDDPNDVFGEWFGDETMRPDGRNSTRWTNRYETQAISLDSVEEVPGEEYEVLTKYLPEIN